MRSCTRLFARNARGAIAPRLGERHAFDLCFDACLHPPPVLSQSSPPGGTLPEFQFEYHPVAWVDPVNGVDTANPANQIDDPDLPFKTLQLAIDSVQADLVSAYTANIEDKEDICGTVYALPGVYGPTGGVNGPNASGDQLPIQLKDRVHVQGMGAGRCIIREYQTDPAAVPGEYNMHWPETSLDCSTSGKLAFVLVDASTASVGAIQRPWFDPNFVSFGQDTTEVFDGFTLQGGDVQVLARSRISMQWNIRVVVSNCVFDMRDDWAPDPSTPSQKVAGPSFGVMMSKGLNSLSGLTGYVDQELLILNNTFVMAQYGTTDWVNAAKNDAVGVIDFTHSNCAGMPCDCDDSHRGIGHPGIINNIFRTLPGSDQRAMMGIAQEDAEIGFGSPTPVPLTNAFAHARVGDNGTFDSLAAGNVLSLGIVPGMDEVWDCAGTSLAANCSNSQFEGCGLLGCSTSIGCPTLCTAATSLPTPRVDLYDGDAASTVDRDPGFVGEYLSLAYNADVGSAYADWRLIPSQSNPMRNKGYAPDPGVNTLQIANGTIFEFPDHPLAPHPFRWDGEGYGNPRVVDGTPDIGHDEVHLLAMTASYAPDSRSHNDPTPNGQGCLNPDRPDGQPKRVILVRDQAAGIMLGTSTPPNVVEVHGNHVDALPLCPNPTAWSQPPATLVPAKNKATLPADYQTKYIRFIDVSLPSLPWGGALTASASFDPLGTQVGQPTLTFLQFEEVDQEVPSGDHWYFCTQAEVLDDAGNQLLRSNLQVEYR